jgi:hypothetical protein
MKWISGIDLSWEFFERMRDAVFRKGVSVAVVPDDGLGWRAVIEGRGRQMGPAARKRFKEIETELRASFSLSDR